MAICPICGCKTDELDFVERKICTTDGKVCSFCSRQLNAFDSTKEPTEAQLRWLTAVIEKDVPEREDNISGALKEIRSRYAETEIIQADAPVQQKADVAQQGFAKKNNADQALIVELQNRVQALENEIRTMKRKQMIKTIIELGAPFVLLIALIIVFLSSGIMDNLKTIFEMSGITL